MSFSGYHNALQQRRCGTSLKSHKGTNDIKRARKHALIQEYEQFRMQKGETISDVQKRFSHIVNHLASLEKNFDKEELNIKILNCLDRSW